MADYYVCSGAAGTGTGLSWVNACISLTALTTAVALAGGDTVYVHNTHAHNAGAGISLILAETGAGLCRVLCVDGGDAAFTAAGASMGTTVGTLTAGASETTGGNNSLTLRSSSNMDAALYMHGIEFITGAGANSASADMNLFTAAGLVIASACKFYVNSTSTSALMTLGANADSCNVIMRDCELKFATTTGATISGTCIQFFNCKIGAGSPTTLFTAGTSRLVFMYCRGCDWTAATNVIASSMTGAGRALFSNCAIATPTTGTHAGYAGMEIEFQACAAADGGAGADILSYYFESVSGTVQDDQTVYKATGGAQGEQDDGTDTSYSLQMDPSTKASTSTPLYTPWIAVLVGSTGSKTVTLKVAHTETAVLTNQDIFMEVGYMGEPGVTGTQRIANSPHAQAEVDDAAAIMASSIARDIIATGSNRTDDAVDDWTGIASEKEHTLTATVTCDEVGYIFARVGLAKDTTNPVYVDPKIGVA